MGKEQEKHIPMISERKILVGCLGAEITDAHSH